MTHPADDCESLGGALEAGRLYLEDESPDRVLLGPVEEPGTGEPAFTLPGNPPYFLAVSEGFLSDHTAREIGEFLRAWGLASLVRSAPGRRVTVMRAGLRLGPSTA
jgi:hypothetical protein